MRGWFRRRALRTVHQFRTRLARYQLQQRGHVRAALLQDPVVTAAITAHARTTGLPEDRVRLQVDAYIAEIVPHFNVLSYYKIGYNLAKLLINLLYKVSVDYQDEAALERIPKQDVVVYLINHRSNADYVVVAYVLAYGVHVSYAVGEWARAWPLEYVFKSFGAYFVRRRFREPLYHAVLERYVRLITRNGVTQGIFPEGGLTRDGRLRSPKLGLLDYILTTLNDPTFTRDIWLVPVAINYDRVLEDRSLIRELVDQGRRPGRIAQLATVTGYITRNLARLVTGRLKRYGRAAVNFGHPALRPRLARHGAPGCAGVAQGAAPPRARAPRPGSHDPDRGGHPRHPRSARCGGPVVLRTDDDPPPRRRLVVSDGDSVVVLPRARPLLEYYANSIAHLLPIRGPRVPFHKTHELETELPQLRKTSMDGA